MTGADSSSSGQGQRALPIADAAELLGVSIETLRKRLQRGREKGYKDTDGTWRVLVDPPAPEPEPVPTAPPAPAEPPPQIVEMLERLSAQVDDLKQALAHQTTLSNALATEVRRLGSETRESLAALQALILSVEVEVAAQDDDRAKRLKKKLKPVLLMIVDLLQRRQAAPAPLPAAPAGAEPGIAVGAAAPADGVTAALGAAAATALSNDPPARTHGMLEAGEALPAAPVEDDDWQALSDIPAAADAPAKTSPPDPADSTLILRDAAPTAPPEPAADGGLAFVEEDVEEDEAVPPAAPAPDAGTVEAGSLAFEDDGDDAGSADGEPPSGDPMDRGENPDTAEEDEEPLLLTDPLGPTETAPLAPEASAVDPTDTAGADTDALNAAATAAPAPNTGDTGAETDGAVDSGSLSPGDIAALLRSMESTRNGGEAPEDRARATAPPLPADAPDGLDALFDPPPPSADPAASPETGTEGDLDAIWSDLPVEEEPDPTEADRPPDAQPTADPIGDVDKAEPDADPVLDFAADEEDDPWAAPLDPPTVEDTPTRDGDEETDAPNDPEPEEASADAMSDTVRDAAAAEAWDAPITEEDEALIDPARVDPDALPEAFGDEDDGHGEALLDWSGTEDAPDDTPTEAWDADTHGVPGLDNLDTDLPTRPAAPEEGSTDGDKAAEEDDIDPLADEGAADPTAEEARAPEDDAPSSGAESDAATDGEAEPAERALLDDRPDGEPPFDPWEEPSGEALLPWDADAADPDAERDREIAPDADETAAMQTDPTVDPDAVGDIAQDTGDEAAFPFADKGSASPARPRPEPVSADPADPVDLPERPDASARPSDDPVGPVADPAADPVPETESDAVGGGDSEADDPFAKWDLPGIDDFDAPEEEAERTVSIRDPFALDGEFLLDFGAEDGEEEEFEDPLALSDDAISWDELEEPAGEAEAADPPGDAAAEKADKTDRG